MKLGVLCALGGSGFSLFLNRQERQVREEALDSFYLTVLRLKQAHVSIIRTAQILAFGALEPAVQLGCGFALQLYAEGCRFIRGGGWRGELLTRNFELSPGDGQSNSGRQGSGSHFFL